MVLVRTPRVEDLLTALEPSSPRIERTGPDTARVTGISASRIGDLAFAAGVPVQELHSEHGGRNLEAAFFALTTKDSNRNRD